MLQAIYPSGDNPDTPEGTRLSHKYTSTEDILENRLFDHILIDSGQGNSNLDPYWGQELSQRLREFTDRGGCDFYR
ncbi:hypothetical protein YC2023_054066 [Brassica napus]